PWWLRLDCRWSLSACWFFARGLSPLLWEEVRDLKVLVEVGRELAPEQGAKLRPDRDLDDGPRRVLAEDVPDRALGVEEGTDRAAGKDPIPEVEAAGPERLQLEGGTPGHFLGVESGDVFLVLVDIGCPPVANPLEQA